MQVHIVTNDTGTDQEEYEDSYLTHIGQIFFEDALVDELLQYEPYTERGGSDVTYLADDNVYTGDNNTIANVTISFPGHFQWGANAALEVIVNPMTVEAFRADNSEGSAGGMGIGMGMGMGGPGMNSSAMLGAPQTQPADQGLPATAG